MPYVKQKEQKRLREELSKVMMGTKGELTAAINILQMMYAKARFSEKGVGQQRTSYQDLSDAMAAASDANNEFYRRVMAGYEDHKRRENGDIFQDFIREANI